MNCQLKKGIFLQRHCDIETDTQCASCDIYVCTKHQVALEEKILCHNCYTKETGLNKNGGYRTYMESESSIYLWYWTMRSDFDTEYGLEAFDESDYAGFERAAIGFTESDTEDDYLDS